MVFLGETVMQVSRLAFDPRREAVPSSLAFRDLLSRIGLPTYLRSGNGEILDLRWRARTWCELAERRVAGLRDKMDASSLPIIVLFAKHSVPLLSLS